MYSSEEINFPTLPLLTASGFTQIKLARRHKSQITSRKFTTVKNYTNCLIIEFYYIDTEVKSVIYLDLRCEYETNKSKLIIYLRIIYYTKNAVKQIALLLGCNS